MIVLVAGDARFRWEGEGFSALINDIILARYAFDDMQQGEVSAAEFEATVPFLIHPG
jgi:hypothetical protein